MRIGTAELQLRDRAAKFVATAGQFGETRHVRRQSRESEHRSSLTRQVESRVECLERNVVGRGQEQRGVARTSARHKRLAVETDVLKLSIGDEVVGEPAALHQIAGLLE